MDENDMKPTVEQLEKALDEFDAAVWTIASQLSFVEQPWCSGELYLIPEPENNDQTTFDGYQSILEPEIIPKIAPKRTVAPAPTPVYAPTAAPAPAPAPTQAPADRVVVSADTLSRLNLRPVSYGARARIVAGAHVPAPAPAPAPAPTKRQQPGRGRLPGGAHTFTPPRIDGNKKFTDLVFANPPPPPLPAPAPAPALPPGLFAQPLYRVDATNPSLAARTALLDAAARVGRVLASFSPLEGSQLPPRLLARALNAARASLGAEKVVLMRTNYE